MDQDGRGNPAEVVILLFQCRIVRHPNIHTSNRVIEPPNTSADPAVAEVETGVSKLAHMALCTLDGYHLISELT